MAERSRRSTKTAERLGRMLAIVPYLVRHPGTELKEAGEIFGVPLDQLRRDLDLLFLSGLPPYGPGDLIDVEVDEDGRIWISMADHFARPLRLTRLEALAVYVRGTELVATPGLPEAPALASALEKLRSSLGPETLGEGGIEAAGTGRAPEHLPVIREAAAQHRRLRISYVASSTGERTDRSIDPEEVFSSLGNWYVAAWDADADAERLFRADRIVEASMTDDMFEPRGLEGAGRSLYTPSQEDVEVRLRLRPPARWIAEYYVTVDAEDRPDGSLDVTLPARQLGWVARLLLRAAPDAEVLKPPELAEAVREMCRKTLARYHR